MTICELLAALNGATVAGGCDTCDAEQTFQKRGRITLATVHHDNDCPTLKRSQARR
ncbi:hypothetical protein AB0F17_63470 [Nonomuraea sp. NPDC026600]|uniref:hypothetical protein n=1 Tax=Nonomuraea sp. NPDC026600 TaxID=3155363 RepID=UPI0033DADE78